MLISLSLDAFKNHSGKSFVWEKNNILLWGNGSWKTNILESIYFFINAIPPTGRAFLQLLPTNGNLLSIGGEFTKKESVLVYTGRIWYTRWEGKVHFFSQNSAITKSRHLDTIPLRAVLFTPMEMNILYLWPSLRRDFLDESLLLSYPEFAKIKREYLLSLKNRNSLLKQIKEGVSSRDTLNLWDSLFVERASLYYTYRQKLLSFIQENLTSLESLLEEKYTLSFEYQTKVDFNNIESSILGYLRTNRERDIITGHTYIWPHLDDFQCLVIFNETQETFPSNEYLSRWENKTILIGLKFILVDFIEKTSGKNTLLLLDDLFSELDASHIESIIENSGNRQLFITTQNMPEFLYQKERFSFHKID